MQAKPTLADLAAALHAALPPGETANYVSDLAMWHTGEIKQCPLKPDNAPYYGPGFTEALTALKMGRTNRIAYHIDRLAAQVRRTGKDGILQEVRRIAPVIGNVPQPTDRRDFQTAHVPRTGKD